MQALLLLEHVVHETDIVLRDLDSTGNVDCLVKRELNALDQVEGDGVFEATVKIVSQAVDCLRLKWLLSHQLESDIGKIESLRGIGQVNCGIHG